MSTVAPEFQLAAELLGQATDSAWHKEARPKQLAPPGDWFIWLIQAGRGFGKTRAGAEWLAERARTTVGEYAVVGRSTQDCKETCVEGQSGLLRALDMDRQSPGYNRQSGQIRLPNGSVIYSYSGERPERVRGPNLSGVWCDEIGHWKYPMAWTEVIVPALRIGNPQAVITTTPRPIPLLREMAARKDGSVVVTRGSTWENAANLSADALAELRRRYSGTRLGQQELEGELLADVEGALWSHEMIERNRVARVNRAALTKIYVGVDPSVSATGDETGIIVAGLDGEGVVYVLADESVKATPDAWAARVVRARDRWQADKIVAEVNQGGALVSEVLRTVDSGLPIQTVSASRGKRTRAEPVVALNEQDRIKYAGDYPELEDQLTSWVPDIGGSPDRLDAFVWAVSALAPQAAMSVQAPFFETRTSRWAPLSERAFGG